MVIIFLIFDKYIVIASDPTIILLEFVFSIMAYSK